MSRTITIVDPNGAHPVVADKLPLQIGSASNADIRIAGAVSDRAFALIDVLDDRPFLQPVGDAPTDRPAMSVNGEMLASTRWLHADDVITVQGTSITCEFGSEALQFLVAYETIEYETAPPVLDKPDGVGDSVPETIAPVRRTIAAETSQVVDRRKRRIRTVGFSALALLLGIAVYLFTAKAVFIDVDPPEASISIAGSLLKLQFGGRYLLRPGGYRVMLAAEGYESLRAEFEVGSAANQDFRFVMDKLPGRLVISSRSGVEARVWVDDLDVGRTPTGEIVLTPGAHTLRLAADRYLAFEATVEVEGRDQLQAFEAELVPGWAEVTLTTVPAGAMIYLEEQELAVTPTTVQLMAGTRELTIQKEGFKIVRQPVTAVANQSQVLPEILLTEADSLLSVMSSPGAAAVSIDSRYRGTTPVDVEVAPGRTYQVIISKPGYATVTRKVTMESRHGRTLRVDLEPRVGVVTITSEPADAELYIDGEPRGMASQTLSLPARPHKIEIRKSGFTPFVTEITPKPGLPEALTARLLTPAEAVLAATPRIVTTSQGLEMLLIAPGQFEMGAPRREQGRGANEYQHTVKLTRNFYLGTREITNNQFREFKPKHTSGAEKYRELATGDHPVVMLSWEDATGFCNWLSHKESLPFAYVVEDGNIVLASPANGGYRLPTEAEWAWAARYNGGGGQRKYSWGDRMPPTEKAGNFADLSARSILAKVLSNYNDGFPITAPVGRFPPSPIGLFDIGGNVAEWVNDRYGVNPDSSGIDINPVGPAEGQYHVIRGSGWRTASMSELRLAYRDFGNRGRLDVGFRIARYADEPTK